MYKYNLRGSMKKINLLCGSLAVAVLGALLTGCSATGSYTSEITYNNAIYGRIAKDATAYEGIKRNPVIVVHGFLGAKLVNHKTKKNVWGDFKGINAFAVSNDEIRELSYPMGYKVPLRQLHDDIVPSELMEDAKISVLGISFELAAYKSLVDILVKGGYYPASRPLPKNRHFNSLFLFAYDWRRDLAENAARLHRYIQVKRRYLQLKYEQRYGIKNFDVQFDIIGHSMGGLVTRYYLRYGNQDLPADGSMPKLDWRGSKYVDRAIIVGTPNAGYLDTFLEMLQGGIFPPAALGTLPTYYQMLPTPESKSIIYTDNKPVDIFDPLVWVKMKWSLVAPNQAEALAIMLPKVKSIGERRKIALDHLTKCLKRARQFQQAMAIKSTPPKDVKLYMVAGNAVKTTRRAHVDRKTGKIVKIDYAPGDGKVLSSSVMFDLRAGNRGLHYLTTPIKWSGIILLRAAHMGLLTAPAFEDNVLFMLLMERTREELQEGFK
jgi:hypothetical protein